MKNNIILILIILAFASVSCKKSEFTLYDKSVNYITFMTSDKGEESHFGRSEVDVSFKLFPGTPIVDAKVKVNLMGLPFTSPTEFAVKVDTEKSTAIEGVHFKKLPESFTFEAGVYESEFIVELIYTPEMEDERFFIELKIEELGNVKPGWSPTTTIGVSSLSVQPMSWWGYVSVGPRAEFLGAYSEDKYEHFIKAVIEAGYNFLDIDFDNYTYGEWYDIATIFKNYLSKYKPVDDEGERITIPFK